MIDLGNGVKLITRAEWGAVAPKSTTPLTPSYGTTTHWEGPHMGTFTHASCYTKVRGIQAFHMGPQRGWSDIAYTALTCPHGYVFQGRWVGRRTAANGTNDGNNRAYAVCYLSGQGDPFTDLAKHAQRTVLDWLDRNGGAGPGRNCHRDWKPTECPGDIVCAWVKAGQPDPIKPPDPTPTPPLEDELPYYHTIRCQGRNDAIVTNTGIRATYHGADEGALLSADAKLLDEAGYVHGKSLNLGSNTGAYDRLMAPVPLSEADILRIMAAYLRGIDTADAQGGEDGLFIPGLTEAARRGAVQAGHG